MQETTGYKWTDPSGMPRGTNGAYDPNTQAIKPDAPTHPTPDHALGPAEQATEDYRQIRFYGADQETLRSKAVARFNSLELLVYSNTIAQLRYPTLSHEQKASIWRGNFSSHKSPRRTRKAAA